MKDKANSVGRKGGLWHYPAILSYHEIIQQKKQYLIKPEKSCKISKKDAWQKEKRKKKKNNNNKNRSPHPQHSLPHHEITPFSFEDGVRSTKVREERGKRLSPSFPALLVEELLSLITLNSATKTVKDQSPRLPFSSPLFSFFFSFFFLHSASLQDC